MERLSFFGVGPKIGKIALPTLAVTIALTILFPAIFTFGDLLRKPLMVAGIVLIICALIFYFATLRLMLPGIKENRLVTTGVYSLSRNPLYAALILFFIPGLGLLLNSWVILLTSLIGYLAIRSLIHEEEEQLERIFGEEYRKYHDRTPLLFPNPFNK